MPSAFDLNKTIDSLWRVTFSNPPTKSLEARRHRLRASCCALASKVEGEGSRAQSYRFSTRYRAKY